MSANKAFNLVLGLLALAFFEGLVAHFLARFPFAGVVGFQSAAVAYILGTKTYNDVAEMKTGIAAKKLDLASGCGK